MLVQAKNAKGFTLVELIVVITILAILATIGFLSLQGYTSDAKDAKIRANLRTVTSALVNEQAMSNNSIDTYIQTGATYAISSVATATGSIYGSTGALTMVSYNNTGSYFVGEVKPSALRIDATKFFDKDSAGTTKPFAIGAVNFSETVNGKSRVRPLFQVATTIKGSASTAAIEGNYGTGATTDAPGLIGIPSTQTARQSVAGAAGTLGTIYPVLNGSTTNYPFGL